MDVDLRKLRYFVAVAEELNYGRAAVRLHVAQPALSRQIRALEKDLGVSLLERSTRGTALSPAGAALLPEARALLSQSAALQRRARVAARGQTQLTIGFMPGVPVSPVIRALQERFEDVHVDVLRTGWHDQVEVLRDGRADVSFLRLPAADSHLFDVRPLFREPRVVAVARGSELDTRPSLHLADLADFDLLQPPDMHPDWREAARLRRPEALTTARERLPVVSTVEEKLEHVAAGRGIVLLPESAVGSYTRPDVVYLPVDGLEPAVTAVAYDGSRASDVVRATVAVAVAELGDAPRDT